MKKDPMKAALEQAVHLLDTCELRGVVVGGLAVSAWGRPRVTQDVDLVVDIPKEKMETFLQTAHEQGYQYDERDALELLTGGFIRLTPLHTDTDVPFPLDILLADTELHQNTLARRMKIQFDDLQIWISAPEELILMKLVAFRPQDTFDLETIIEEMRGHLDLST